MWFGLNWCIFVCAPLDNLHTVIVTQACAEDSSANWSTSHYFHMKTDGERVNAIKKGNC